VIVSQEKRVIVGAYGHQGNALGYRLLQIVMDDDDREIIALGTREACSELQLLTFSVSNIKDVPNIKRGKKLADMTPQSKYVATVSSVTSSSIKQRYLLLAVWEDLIVRVARVNLDA
jgi:3-polyprenyl-4-hydroxybenzoate decarboxylase